MKTRPVFSWPQTAGEMEEEVEEGKAQLGVLGVTGSPRVKVRFAYLVGKIPGKRREEIKCVDELRCEHPGAKQAGKTSSAKDGQEQQPIRGLLTDERHNSMCDPRIYLTQALGWSHYHCQNIKHSKRILLYF